MIDRSQDAIQEEVAAARGSSFGPFVLFLASILLPLAGAFWLIAQARESTVEQEAVIRTMVESGLAPQIIDAYVNDHLARSQLPGAANDQPSLPAPERHRRWPRWRRWRRRKRFRPDAELEPP